MKRKIEIGGGGRERARGREREREREREIENSSPRQPTQTDTTDCGGAESNLQKDKKASDPEDTDRELKKTSVKARKCR
jgi:hypothetical protein